MTCVCNCTNCKEKHYIVLQDFWLDHNVKLYKTQIIHGPVSPRWLQLRLITDYNPDQATAELAAKTIVENSNIQLSDENAVVATDAVEVVKRGKKRKAKEFAECPQCNLEVPEKSEVLLEELQKAEQAEL